MRRRELLLMAIGIMAARAVRARQKAMPVIGILGGGSSAAFAPFVAAFQEGLRETGYIQGQDVAIEHRWAEGQPDRLAMLATDLVRRRVAVIIAVGTVEALAAKAATPTIPIVFRVGTDPVALSRHLIGGGQQKAAFA